MGGWEGAGGSGKGQGAVGAGGQAEGGHSLQLGHRQQCCVPADNRNVHKPQDRSRRHWQQSDTQPILISAPPVAQQDL